MASLRFHKSTGVVASLRFHKTAAMVASLRFYKTEVGCHWDRGAPAPLGAPRFGFASFPQNRRLGGFASFPQIRIGPLRTKGAPAELQRGGAGAPRSQDGFGSLSQHCESSPRLSAHRVLWHTRLRSRLNAARSLTARRQRVPRHV